MTDKVPSKFLCRTCHRRNGFEEGLVLCGKTWLEAPLKKEFSRHSGCPQQQVTKADRIIFPSNPASSAVLKSVHAFAQTLCADGVPAEARYDFVADFEIFLRQG